MKVLLLSCNTGQGHNSTAASVRAAFEKRGNICVTEDAMAFVSKRYSDFVCFWFTFAYRYLPKMFGIGYDIVDRHPGMVGRHSLSYRILTLGVDKLGDYIEKEGFDCVVCSHEFAAQMLTELRKRGRGMLPTGYVVTDYTCYPGAADCNVDAIFIPHEELTEDFLALGAPQSRIVASGIPIRDVFLHKKEREQVRREWNIPLDAPHLMMMCGSMGCGPMVSLTGRLKKSLPSDAVLTVICGSNKRLKKKLDRFADERTRIIGYTDKVSDLMDSADLYLTKPGGLSVTEASVKGLPLAFVDVVNGCERYNHDFFASRGLALTGKGSAALAKAVAQRLNEREALNAQRKKAVQMFTHRASDTICDFFEQARK